MPSDFKEDQAEELRKHFGEGDSSSPRTEDDNIDVLNLPSRKEKYKKKKVEPKEIEDKQGEKRNKRKRRRVKFPLVRILLFLFLLLVTLVLTYPNWTERLNL